MRAITIAAAVLLSIGAAHAQVYKCPGPDGKVTYSQAPCASSGQVLDSRRPPSPAEQARQPLTQRREVERAMQPSAPAPDPSRPTAARGPCVSDTELRNYEVSASSITMKGPEKEQRMRELRAARACRANGTTFDQEMAAIQAESDRKKETQEAVREQMENCRVSVSGNAGPHGNVSGSGRIRCREPQPKN